MSSTHQIRENLTLGQFLQLFEEEPPLEYIDGRIEAKVSPQKKHSQIQSELRDHINRFAKTARLGLAFIELRCTFGGWSIVPDVAFLLREHIELDEVGELVDETNCPPDIHVELISPDKQVKRSHGKLLHSTANGCSLGCLIDPYKRTIDVYRPGRPPERLTAGGFLEGEPVLPGYRLPVAEIFGWLKLSF
jgi:Uma2 family endonuclease